MNVNDIIMTSIETITAFDITTGAYLFTLDELQNASIAQSQESTEITGRQGRKLASLKRNKAVTISGSSGVVSGGLLEMQTGGPFEYKDTKVLWKDYLTVNSSKATTSWKAVGTTGAEIKALYIRNSDGTLGEALEQNDTAESGKFAYSPADKTLTFHTDVKDGTEIIVYYNRKITADVLVDQSNTYSRKCALYVEIMGEDKCANVYHIQFFVPKADFSGDFNFEMGDNQTVHSFEAEAMSGACGANGTYFTYTIFGENTKDSENP